MRRRLMTAILVLVAGTLLLAGVGSVLLIRRAAASTAEQELYKQARALADYPNPEVFVRAIHVVKIVGQYQALTVVGMAADGTFSANLPTALHGVDLDTAALQQDHSVTGAEGRLVYVLIPLQLTTRQKAHLDVPVPYQDTAVLVATRTVPPPVGGFGVYLLLALVCLAVAGVVAYWLARRFSRPLVVAAQATERIAGGDLGTPIPVGRHDMPEFASLAGAINAMSASLRRARDQQRHFLLSVSHDLRTPLTSIRGYAEALADGTTDDVPAALAVIDAEARRLERLVGDLLDLARLDAERFSFQWATLDVAETVRQVAQRQRPAAEASGLAVDLVPATGPLPVVADADRLQQLLGNLVENARKFARSRVTLGAAARDGTVVIWVEDDGSGIAAEDLPRVFEPHFTSDRDGRRRTGTGLGLAIVAELATAMGGGVRAQSPVSEAGGTRMVAWLPAAPGGGPGAG